jgi:intermediate cleaving peptidase 55
MCINLSAEKNSSPRGFRMLLYSTGKDVSKEKWDGASTRFADVVTVFGADDARPLDNFVDDLRALVARSEHVYVDLPSSRHRHHHPQHHHHRRISGSKFLLKYLSRHSDDDATTGTPQSYLDVIAAAAESKSKRRALAPLVGVLRSVKSRYEVEAMKASAEISARAHAKVSTTTIVRGFQ